MRPAAEGNSRAGAGVKRLPVFTKYAEEIGRKYQEFGYKLGWSFLYTPAKTLSSKTRIVFIGLNPGGFNPEKPMPSYEKGNAYRIERWGHNGQMSEMSNLQKQICNFFEQVAFKIGESPEHLMDSTLAANFCPFRSGNWAKLKNKKEAIKFSKSLWSGLFDELKPSVVVCLGNETFFQIYPVLTKKGFKELRSEKLETGWGKIKCHVIHLNLRRRKIILVGLPHLSRFGIFGRHSVRSELKDLVKTVARRLSA
jgi:hypothetical protein